MSLSAARACLFLSALICLTDTLLLPVAPATGTPETGGWSTRELRTILRGLDGLNFVGADIVEVAPAYDTNAELTTMCVDPPCPLPWMRALPLTA